MRALDVFKARHTFAYEIFFSNLWTRYTETQLRMSVHPTTNSLAWLMWHIARVEDAGVARFVMREPQVLHSGAWGPELDVDVEHFGFQMSRAEMRELSEQVNIDALCDYQAAVRAYVYDAITRVTPERLDETLSPAEVQEVMVLEGVGHPTTGVMVPYVGWTRLEALYHFSTTHYYWHGGEVRTIESMMRHSA